MIKFFRHIRRSLIQENKMGKYFKYAIGEIILVMIGILLALQVNNWNTARKDSVKEKRYLQSFKIDIENSVEELNRVKRKANNISESANLLLKFERGELDSFTTMDFFLKMLDANGYTIYNVQQGTIDDIRGSGDLDIIKNDSVRLAMSSWESFIHSIRAWERLDVSSSDEFNKYMSNNVNLYKGAGPTPEIPITKNDINQFIKDRVFLNIVSNRLRFPKKLSEYYDKEIKRLNDLLGVINTELKDD